MKNNVPRFGTGSRRLSSHTSGQRLPDLWALLLVDLLLISLATPVTAGTDSTRSYSAYMRTEIKYRSICLVRIE